ncbi:MAG TPA: hypothetical protein DEV63_09610, partial [Algoriphagus sp.]|nr:hypothetical protein [Algoriphagus sp.]
STGASSTTSIVSSVDSSFGALQAVHKPIARKLPARAKIFVVFIFEWFFDLISTELLSGCKV